MMRRRLTTLTLLSTYGLLVLVAVGALGAEFVHRSASGGPDAAKAASGRRSFTVSLSPAPDDLALAELSFRAPQHRFVAPSALRVGVRGPLGDDYMAAAVPSGAKAGVGRALVLIVNRPSPLMDPVSVPVRLAAPRWLGVPLVRRRTDPFTGSSAQAQTIPCNLTRGGAPLVASQLSALGSRGAPLEGFAGTSAVAQAYDVVCELPYASAFKRAVERSSPASPTPEPAPPAPEPPVPPVGKLPGEGCTPTPGYACPG